MFKSYRFSLIELIIILVILTELILVVVVAFGNIQRAGRDDRRKVYIDTLPFPKEKQTDSHGVKTTYPPLANSIFSSGTISTNPNGPSEYTYTTTILSGADYIVCGKLETGKNGNASDPSGTPAVNSGFYCRKARQP